jgi:branched-chain amino acid transport system substrate-binding protein
MKDTMAKQKHIGITILAVALAALLLLTACIPTPTGPLKKKAVEIACLIGLTGPAGGPSSYVFHPVQDYLDYFNEENKIPEVALELVWADTGTVEPREISAYQRFVAKGIPIMVSVIDSEKFRPWTERDEVPMISLAQTEGIMYPPCWIYSIYPTWAESYYVWCKWIMQNWKEARAPRVVAIGPDTVTGPHSVEPARSYVESLGIEMMPSEFVVGYAPLDTSAELLRMNANGADYVYILPIWTVSAIIMKDADRLGLAGKMNFGGMENTQSTRMLKQVGPATEGYTAPRVGPWFDETEIPGIKLLQDLRKKYGRPFDFSGDDSNGFVAMAVACEAVKRAIEEVGYENLDGRAVKMTLDSIKDFDFYGIKQITYTPEDHRGWNRARVYQVQDGEVIPVSDWLEAPMVIPEG